MAMDFKRCRVTPSYHDLFASQLLPSDPPSDYNAIDGQPAALVSRSKQPTDRSCRGLAPHENRSYGSSSGWCDDGNNKLSGHALGRGDCPRGDGLLKVI
jgi:hypothetical protein